MPDIDDIWSEDEQAELDRRDMLKDRYMSRLLHRDVVRTQDPRGCDAGRKIATQIEDEDDEARHD